MSLQQSACNRRWFLKASGVSIALPGLGMPASGRADTASHSAARFVAICGGLGFHAPLLFPDKPGFDYRLTPYLELIKDHRQDFTLFSGLSHPDQNGNNGHASILTWLTSAPHPGLAGFRNTISLDQLMAGRLGAATRFPSLCLTNDGNSLSWTSNGINLPAESSPAKLFQKMFVAGTEAEIAQELHQLARGRSILETVLGDARKLERALDTRDRQKLDEYFTAVRELEKRIGESEGWAQRPKPLVDHAAPFVVVDKQDIVARQRAMYDLIVLALHTDSTRIVTLSLGSLNAVPNNIPGVTTDWHNLSHHGKDEAKIEELRRIEEAEFHEFNRFLGRLKQLEEDGRSLLDATAVLFGSNLGNASSHDWRNLPILLAGGGYRHGAYVAHDPGNNTPLANLFVAEARRMGVEIEGFGTSTSGTLRGLEA
jgi:hypothetical protein